MQRNDGEIRRPSLSLPILRTARRQHRAGTLTLGSLLSALGEASFGWAIVMFSLLTLLPLPPGSSLITALPLLVTTAQMMLGYPHVKLPGRLARLRIDPLKLRRTVLAFWLLPDNRNNADQETPMPSVKYQRPQKLG